MHEEIFETRKSEKFEEALVELYGTGPAVVRDEGASTVYDAMGQGLIQRATHTEYTKALIITKIAIEDNLYRDHIARMAPEIAKSMVESMEVEASNVLNRAFNTSYTFADGQPLCDTDKVVSRTGGTYANKPSSASDLSEASLEQAVLDIHALVGSDGLRADISPTALIVPTGLEFDAHRILDTSGRVATTNNDINVLKAGGYIPKLLVWRYLTDTDAWFVKTDAPDGLIKFMRREAAIDSDNDFATDNMLFKGTVRFSLTSGDQRSIYGNAGA